MKSDHGMEQNEAVWEEIPLFAFFLLLPPVESGS
jgi:hypothetical protein